MNEQTTQTPALDKDFLRRIGNDNAEPDPDLMPAVDYMKNYLTKEMKMKDFNERLLKTRQEKVIIKEVLLESELDLVNSIKQLKSVFKEELRQAIDKVNDLYTNELFKLQELYREALIGDKLLEIVKTVSKSGWYLLMKDKSVNLCKFYQPSFEVITGYYSSKGNIREYESPICYLKAIYVNILHTHVTSGTVRLSSDNQHPNADRDNFGTACVGDLEGREIPLHDPEKLLLLLNEISFTYERIHLDSCYFTPDDPYKIRKDQTWTTKAG